MIATTGLFHGKYSTNVLPVPPSVLKSGERAYVFPGQGSAFQGMFSEQLRTIPQFVARFAQVDRMSAGFDLLPPSLFIARPAALPLEKMHIYRNCAIFASEVAIAEYAIEQGLEPAMLTGHSFGECAALVVAGIIDFETMFTVVAFRNLLAPQANKLGIMVAASGTVETLAPVLREKGVFLANRNSMKQLVLSISAESKDSILGLLRKSRIAHVVLQQLPQPYHSPLMEEFRIKFHERISQMELKPQPPKYPMFSGVSKKWITSENYLDVDYVDLLSRQVTEPVDFVTQLEELRSMDATSFYEVGPGRMLETPIRGVINDIPIAYRDSEGVLQGLGVERKENKEGYERLKRSKWFDKIKTAIQTVAGYKEDEIDISFNFQNDLGIDSIKKAEILFKVINDDKTSSTSNMSIAQFNTISQAVDYLENHSDTTDPLRQSHEPVISLMQAQWRECARPAHYMFEKSLGTYDVLRLKPELDGELGFLTDLEKFSSLTWKTEKKPLVVLEFEKQTFDAEKFVSTFHARYAAITARDPDFRFNVVVADWSGEETYRPIAALFKSLRKEVRRSQALYICSDRPLESREIVGDLLYSPLRDIRYSNGTRSMRDYVPFKVPSRYARENPVTVVAIGGSRGINFEVLKNFPTIAGDRLVLLGRSVEQKKDVAPNIAKLRAKWPNFTYAAADASNYESVEAALKSALENDSIDILFNACGYEVSKSFDEKDRSDLMKEFKSKWTPFQNVERLKTKFKIGTLIHYSSLVTEFGNRGQTVYSLSNALIERDCKKSGSHSISWGPWENVGMTENQGIQARLKEWGISLVPPEHGAALTYRLLFSGKKFPTSVLGFDSKDVFLFTSDRDSMQEDSPFVGSISNAFEAAFTKEMDVANEPFLKDHRHEEKPLVPASYLLATFSAVARAQFGRMVSLSGFEIQNPMVIEVGHFQAKYQAFYRAPHFAQAYSIVPHCSVNFDPNPEWTVPDRPKFNAVRKVDVSSFVDHWKIKIGPSFRLIQFAELDETNRVRLLIDGDRFPKYLGDDYFDYLVGLFEVALESCTIQANLDLGAVTIPLACDKILFSPTAALTRHLRVRPFINATDSTFRLGEVDVENSEGEIVCRFVGFKAPLLKIKDPSVFHI
jgi:[acyl-carrier-protein] S-malonyltransferase